MNGMLNQSDVNDRLFDTAVQTQRSLIEENILEPNEVGTIY